MVTINIMETKKKKVNDKEGLKGFNIFVDEKRAQMLAILFQAIKDDPKTLERVARTAEEDFAIEPDEFNELYREIHYKAADAKFKDSRHVYGDIPEKDDDPKTIIESITKKENVAMGDDKLRRSFDTITRIGKNETNGFFIISENIDDNDDSLTTQNQAKVTNVNRDQILKTVVTCLQMDKKAVKIWADMFTK